MLAAAARVQEHLLALLVLAAVARAQLVQPQLQVPRIQVAAAVAQALLIPMVVQELLLLDTRALR